VGYCEPGLTANSRLLPEAVVRADCYRFDPTKTAACQTNPPPTGQMIDSQRQNIFDRSYPPVYYYVEGFLVGPNVGISALLMRCLNALIYIALMVAVYALVGTGLRRALVGGAILTAVPYGMFLIPSINPSGWGLTSATTL